MSKLPLIDGVLNYVKENNSLFCMPGHKSGNGFYCTPEGKELLSNFINCDLTEVDGLDNLHSPEGIIKESGELLSRYYCSKKSYFLINGSTSGNLAMIFAAFNEGDKIIVERNCHRSIFNGIIMRKLKPIYLKNRMYNEYNAPLSLDMDYFYKTIQENKDSKGIIITYPNYYGVCSDLKEIIKIAKKYNMFVCVDSAHGAHFGCNNRLPASAIKLGADAVVTSAHKTLPSLTQTAYLHINNELLKDNIEFYISLFSSTSPSYLLLCSMDYARFYMENYGKQAYDDLLNVALKYKEKINQINYLHILSSNELKNVIIDETRYVLNVKEEYSAYDLLDYLRKCKIQAEMSDGNNIILIFSPFNKEEEFEKLYKALKNYNFQKLKNKYIFIKNEELPLSRFLPYEVLNMKKIEIKIDEAEKKVCAENIVPYPPGIPIVMMGEVIDSNIINVIKYYLRYQNDILGLKNEKLKVVDI